MPTGRHVLILVNPCRPLLIFPCPGQCLGLVTGCTPPPAPRSHTAQGGLGSLRGALLLLALPPPRLANCSRRAYLPGKAATFPDKTQSFPRKSLQFTCPGGTLPLFRCFLHPRPLEAPRCCWHSRTLPSSIQAKF